MKQQMRYDFVEIEKKWRKYWAANNTFRADNKSSKPKFYVLDMFPYPSGQGLHVGHPLGYIASDIYTRYKRLRGFNVLHPMGYDAFGLPAEQYAIQTGQHPAITTEDNIERYRTQLELLGFSFDWEREVRTCEPGYYKWTQWIFMQLFKSWYNKKTDKAEPIDALIEALSKSGTAGIDAHTSEVMEFTAAEWIAKSEHEKQEALSNYRLAYLSEAYVNWCPELGTVLANEEVKDGLSERGGFPVERRMMKQWLLRITAYSDRLLSGLDKIEWSEALKEMQKNWIGKSKGASMLFSVDGSDEKIKVFTTRPDTVFGATFMVLAPEHDLVEQICTEDRKEAVDDYVEQTKKRSERERMADVKQVSGEFTGAWAIHPFSSEKIPIWISDYVLLGYGTGAIMAVPSGDQRDWEFATHFDIPIVPVVSNSDPSKGANEDKDGVMINSDFLDGLKIPDAINTMIDRLEKDNTGEARTNYKLRDSVFSRQRYWGEPFPIYYKDGMPYGLEENELPLELPEVDKYLPTETGDAPLGRAKSWNSEDGHPLDLNTMPGWAGSSWYYLRYMDPGNTDALASKEAIDYWQNVDLYIGGAEHATGHLLYVRFWTKFLHDLNIVPFDEPMKKLVNQGMILGPGGEKMSKSKGNVINPDDLVVKYGADTLRMYEMFLGPLQDAKPWDTHGIEGVFKFLNKLWKLYDGVEDSEPHQLDLTTLHKTIKKVQSDIENLSFNTSVSAFMICVNELSQSNCNSKSILSDLAIIVSPFAPHIAEEIWEKLGNKESISFAAYPGYDEEYLQQDTYVYPVSFNGKVRFKIELSVELSTAEIESEVLEHDISKKWLDGSPPKRVIVVPQRIVNVVI